MEKNGAGLETELRLGLPGGEVEKNEKKRGFSDFCGIAAATAAGNNCNDKNKNQIVGWPPVAAHRRKSSSFNGVKVSMDGAPYLRKIDLGGYGGYSQLVGALQELFGCFDIVKKQEDEEKGEYVPIYEDKDGDWMLLGDVPWGMFAETCRRLRIMKQADAPNSKNGLIKGLLANKAIDN
ncbi:auxin-induced protein AUX22-like [Andrographis paniculata]|uniref:auxin-induced protein AUX22-like n=1 Tax=Andrographis paniculata TaxID=175694 RepID=UPI0021E9694A|nr:auxin-induced protein AUX22-like [Andrographis paniculata]